MTIHRLDHYAIKCDGCPAQLHHPRHSVDGLHLVADAGEWARMIDGRHYCPECKNRTEQTEAKKLVDGKLVPDEGE